MGTTAVPQLPISLPTRTMPYNETYSGQVDDAGGQEYSNCVFTSGTKITGCLDGTVFTNCTMLQIDFTDGWGSPTFNNCTVQGAVHTAYPWWDSVTPTCNNTAFT